MSHELILDRAPPSAGAAARQGGPFAVHLDLPGGRQWAAVDRFAVRSLCWRLDRGRLRVAERAIDLVDAGTLIDAQAIFDYLYFHVIPSPRTIFRELFGGNARYAMQRIFGWYWKLPAPLRRMPLLKRGSGYIRYAEMPMPDRGQAHNLVEYLGLRNVLTDDFLAQVDLGAPLRQQREAWAEAAAEDPIDRELAFDWRYTLAENDLPKVRGASTLAGVGVAFPLLAPELVDFSMRLPTDYKLKGRRLRWFFKEALRGFLPEEIIRKKKHGFGLPFGPWGRRHDALRALASDAACGVAAQGTVRSQFVDDLLTRRLQEHAGYYGEMLWILMMLEFWLRRHAPNYAAC